MYRQIIVTSNRKRSKEIFPDAYKYAQRLKDITDIMDILDFEIYEIIEDWDDDDKLMTPTMRNFLDFWKETKSKWQVR